MTDVWLDLLHRPTGIYDRGCRYLKHGRHQAVVEIDPPFDSWVDGRRGRYRVRCRTSGGQVKHKKCTESKSSRTSLFPRICSGSITEK